MMVGQDETTSKDDVVEPLYITVSSFGSLFIFMQIYPIQFVLLAKKISSL